MPISKSITQAAKKLQNKMQKLKYSWKTYDLWDLIHKHPWLKETNPYKKARDWYIKISRDEMHHLRGQFMVPGKLYIFNYDTPKYQDVLPWFDTQPLVLSLGPIKTKEGIRNLGLNMHLLPPTIRRIVLVKIFEMNKSIYKDQLFNEVQKQVPVKWQELIKPLEKYGIAFCIRMYIPELQRNIVEFKYEEWKDAIYIESKGLNKITFEELRIEWANFVHKSGNKALKTNWATS